MDNEKQYCSCSPADIAAILGNNYNRRGDRDDLVELLLILGYGNGGLGLGRNGFGMGYGCGCGINSEIESLRNQISDNKNSSDLMAYLNSHNSLLMDVANRTNSNVDNVRERLCTINAALGQIAERFGTTKEAIANQVVLGTKDIMAMFSQCCCEQKMLIQQMGYEGQLRDQANHSATMSRIDQMAQRITEGFSATAYEQAKLHAESLRAGEINTQRIIDTLNGHWQQAQAQELADAKLRLSQHEQNAYLLDHLKKRCECDN